MLGGAAALAGAAFVGRGSAGAQDATPDASPVASGLQPDGTWVFTDDRGVTITLPKMPERIVADINAAATLWDFGVRPVGLFGWNIVSETESAGGSGGNVDLSTAEIVSSFGSDQIDVEKLAAVQPDLIISLVFAPEYGIWSINADAVEEVESRAPILCLSGIVRADEALQRAAELSAALGIDLESPELAEQKAGYDQAVAAFEALMAEKAGLTALFIAPDVDAYYVANPEAAPDVKFYRDLGLTVPEIPVPPAEYWEMISLEEAVRYPTDVLLYSLRGSMLGLEAFQEHPTFSLHPAVQAGQVYPWNQDVVTSYLGLTRDLTDLTAALSAADPAVGEL